MFFVLYISLHFCRFILFACSSSSFLIPFYPIADWIYFRFCSSNWQHLIVFDCSFKSFILFALYVYLIFSLNLPTWFSLSISLLFIFICIVLVSISIDCKWIKNTFSVLINFLWVGNVNGVFFYFFLLFSFLFLFSFIECGVVRIFIDFNSSNFKDMANVSIANEIKKKVTHSITTCLNNSMNSHFDGWVVIIIKKKYKIKSLFWKYQSRNWFSKHKLVRLWTLICLSFWLFLRSS